jgi:NHLM bacteriocin system ABC transporter ATP-binding protein
VNLVGLERYCEGGVKGPCRLAGPEAGYLVQGGEADLFAVRRHIGGRPSRRHHVARVPDGAFVPSSTAIGAWQLILVPLPGTALRALPPGGLTLVERHARLTARARPGTPAAAENGSPPRASASQHSVGAPARVEIATALAAAVDLALLATADAVRRGQPPREASTLQPGQIVSVPEGGALTGAAGVWWLRSLGGCLRRNGGGPGDVSGGHELLLLAGRDWVVAESACAVETLSTSDLLGAGELRGAVDQHVARLLRVVEARIEEADAALLRTVELRKRADAELVAGAARRSIGVIGAGGGWPPDEAAETDLHRSAAAALRVVGGGAPVREPADRTRQPSDGRAALRAVARTSGLHLRELRLPDRWWRRDLGPLIGLHATAGPVPLVFRRGRYRRVDPETRASVAVDAAAAASFDRAAAQVQPPLPAAAGLRDVLRLSFAGTAVDARWLLLAAMLVAALGLGLPLATGKVLGRLAATGTVDGLTGLLGLLLAAGTVAVLVGVAQNLRLLRLEGRAQAGAQLAVWDRLMRLPVRFFGRRSSGEIANALLGISFVGDALSGMTPQIVTGFGTALAATVLLCVVEPVLGAWAVALIVAAGLVFAAFAVAIARRQRRALATEHRAAAVTNQLLVGITKIKLAAAEARAHARWTDAAALARADLQRVRQAQAGLAAVGAVLPVAGQLVLFGVLAGPLAGEVTPETFFVLNVCFGMLLGGLLVLVVTGVEVIAAVPRLGGLRDVLAAVPEQRPDTVDPGDLHGEIALHRVTFAYHPDEPPVLTDVDLRVRPGEFVAIVGPSGSGKSTLLRLLLGFERQQQGAVLYDGQDLAELDVQAVRRQCGVVLQDGRLFAGTIRENISGAGTYSLDQVWDAARMAGLADDLERLPMGVNTMMPFGGGTLSVGQRQRVLIARALVHRPRIVFFDEATSALDNRTQDVVIESTRALAATRIVIAHRLSTVRDADTIVVLEHGRIVQRGTYADLMADESGLFHRLARRQLLAAAPED